MWLDKMIVTKEVDVWSYKALQESRGQLAKCTFRLASGQEWQTAMGAKAKEAAKQYQWREIARQYLAVYHEARERSRGKSLR